MDKLWRGGTGHYAFNTKYILKTVLDSYTPPSDDTAPKYILPMDPIDPRLNRKERRTQAALKRRKK